MDSTSWGLSGGTFWYTIISQKKVHADVLFDLIGSKDGADFAESWGGCLPGVSTTKFGQNWVWLKFSILSWMFDKNLLYKKW